MLAAILLLSLDLRSLLGQHTIAGERICDAAGVQTFYERRGLRPAWSGGELPALLRAIDGLAAEGLQPARYHRAALVRLPEGGERDILATDAFLVAATHVSQGVVDPQFARPAWCPTPTRLDLAGILESALADHAVAETLQRLTTQHGGYKRLREALAVYRRIAEAGGWNPVSTGRSLRKDDDDPRVAEVRERLAREPISLAEKMPRAASPGTATLFDAQLDALVRHFQSHHGIEVDGIVGPETLRELNIPAAERAQQIAVNMERWRWMPEDPGKRYVVVNIAAFRLDLIEEGRSALSMKTVVGKDYTRTPFFAARITEVIVNPWWNVPSSIAVKELWPKRRRDRSYFAREHMIVVNGQIRQRPGEWNSLGRLKFNMPNPYNVYLHDTPAKTLFTRSFRAFSHGCIRLERPLDLALELLRDQPQWTRETIEADIASTTERTIPLTTPQPVYVLYWTALVADDGHVEFHRDLYERDATIAQALR